MDNQPPISNQTQTVRSRVNSSLWLKLGIGCCGGCGIVLLILVILGIFIFQAGNRSLEQADIIGRQFIQAVQDNQPEKAYALTATEWRQSSSLATLKKIMTAWRSLVGKFGNISRSGWWFNMGTGGRRMTIVYEIQGSKNAVQVSMVLLERNDSFRLLTCDFTAH